MARGEAGKLGEETYLGDGLYASFDGWHVALRAAGREHVVFLEPDVLDAFMKWLDYCTDRGETHGNA